MSNVFLNELQSKTNYRLTENGAITHSSTLNGLFDMFALGGAYRNRTDADVILLFKNALEEDETYALKCLFYLRDVRGGQGERRFFRVCMKWLANTHKEIAFRNLQHIPEFGRWDDLYCFVGTPLEDAAFSFMREQLAKDIISLQKENCGVSLLGKWLKSCNTSSFESRKLGNKTREYLNMTHREYRKTLSMLRERIKIVEKLMSQDRWDEIEFDKIPSKAGLIYKNAFARKDILKEKYHKFATNKETTVNAATLYPYECVEKALQYCCKVIFGRKDEMDIEMIADRAMINKYWDNLTDYFNEQQFNGIAVVDTSGSMHGTPIEVAISLGLYCAERCNGPFAQHYISFASRPQLIKTEGVDFVDKVKRIWNTNLVDNTNIEAVFDLLLQTALDSKCSEADLPQNILIISDMEFDAATSYHSSVKKDNVETLLEGIAEEWKAHGLNLPHLIFWNVDARQDNIPMIGKGRISYVSGFSPVILQTILSGKTGFELCLETLDAERYSVIK